MYNRPYIKKLNTKTMHQLYDEIEESKSFFVDSKAYQSGWKKGWICYIDLLAFASMCLASNDSTVNTIVRFHKIIDSALTHFPSKFFQFTDACYYISDAPEMAIGFAIEVMNGCCAMNEWAFRSKGMVLAHHLMRPRITIAFGDFLIADNLNNNFLKKSLNKHTFLAGAGIVKAYQMEKSSFSHAITIRNDNDLFKNFAVGGDSCSSCRGLNNWVVDHKDKEFGHLPWPYIKTIHLDKKTNGIKFIPLEHEHFSSQMAHLLKTHDIMVSEFFNLNLDPAVGKHSTSLMRFILNLHRYVTSSKGISQDWVKTIREFYPKK